MHAFVSSDPLYRVGELHWISNIPAEFAAHGEALDWQGEFTPPQLYGAHLKSSRKHEGNHAKDCVAAHSFVIHPLDGYFRNNSYSFVRE
jgi:hypothetical protein